jgi:SAM-dependent methyltransferase
MNENTERVAAGYDTVYAALPRSATFGRIWHEHAMGADFPDGFEHISFLTLADMRRMATELRLHDGSVLLDLACGMGGPGLWLAREGGARLIGLDISEAAVAGARQRARTLGMAQGATFERGSFAETGLEGASVDAAMSVDALQYAPDKQAAFDEIARVLKPGGRLCVVCFVLEPERVAALPIFGDDPVPDYAPLLERAGFDVTAYDETAGWKHRVTSAYQAVIDAKDMLAGEMGDAACNALLGEMTLTLQLQPYRSRVLFAATRR